MQFGQIAAGGIFRIGKCLAPLRVLFIGYLTNHVPGVDAGLLDALPGIRPGLFDAFPGVRHILVQFGLPIIQPLRRITENITDFSERMAELFRSSFHGFPDVGPEFLERLFESIPVDVLHHPSQFLAEHIPTDTSSDAAYNRTGRRTDPGNHRTCPGAECGSAFHPGKTTGKASCIPSSRRQLFSFWGISHIKSGST